MIDFFGPRARYQGLFGLVGMISGFHFTIHFFPRSNANRWGFSKIQDDPEKFDMNSFDLGPLLSICWSR